MASKKTKLLIAPCTFVAAKYACLNFHYAKAVPAGKLVKFGVWEDDKFIGAVIFGRGANYRMLRPFGLNPEDGCELVRVALSAHKTPVSRIMALAIKELKKSCSGLKLVVSYADGRQKHLGVIYQAGNWIYTGMTGTTPDYFYNGRWVHNRTISSLIKSGSLTPEQKHKLEKRAGGVRLRYLYPLESSIRKQVELESKPYPKKFAELV